MESTKTKEKLENLTVDSLIYLTIRELNLLGQYYGLDDVSEDSNLRTLQLLMWFDLRAIPGRQGHDARDKEGLPWELKASKTGRVFSTSHHLTLSIIEGYRKNRFWAFGCAGQDADHPWLLGEVYLVETTELEVWFRRQEKKLIEKNIESINDPRILLSFVREVGIRVEKPIPKGMKIMEFVEKMKSRQEKEVSEFLAKEIAKIYGDTAEVRSELESLQQNILSLRELMYLTLSKELVQQMFDKVNLKLDTSVVKSSDQSIAATGVVEAQIEAQIAKTPPKMSDEELEARQRLFYSELMVLDPGHFVSDATVTKSWKEWHLIKYKGEKAPKKRAHITNKINTSLGLRRDEKGRIFGLGLK